MQRKVLMDLKGRTFRDLLLSPFHPRPNPFVPGEAKIMTENQPSGSKPLPLAGLAKDLRPSLGAALRLLLQPSTLRQWPRLLREGIGPMTLLLIQANNIAILNRLLNKGKKVVFISSFPRSGNTWMRYLLTDIVLQMHDVETTTELPVHPENLIPELRCDSLLSRFARCPHWAMDSSTVFIKTHFLFERLEQMPWGNGWRGFEALSGGRAPFRDCRALYFYRSPEDALVSLYHLSRRDAYVRSRALHGIDAFCRKVVSSWMENIESYFRAADNGFPVFFVSYERMLEEPAIALDNMLHWLGVPHDGQMVQRAVSNMQFRKLQAMEIQANKTRNPASEQKLFFRRGGLGSGCVELQESTVREIRQRTASLMNEANRRRMKQPSEQPAPAVVFANPSGAEGQRRNGEARESRVLQRPQRV